MSYLRIILRNYRVKKNDAQSREGGFTLLELSLAMVFLAFIMIFIVTVLLQMINIYNKTIALSQMDQASRQIMSDLSSLRYSVGSVPNPIYLNNGSVVSSSSSSNGGRICFSNGTDYIWNLAGNNNQPSSANSASSVTNFSLIRVSNDTSGYYCGNPQSTIGVPNGSSGAAGSGATGTVLIGSNILLQSFVPTQAGNNSSLLSLTYNLSTAGNNAPGASGQPAGKCGTNTFCAFYGYNLMIYMRGL